MQDAFDYQSLYDRLREEGYHEKEDGSTHLAPYIPWLQANLDYKTVLDIGCSAGGSLPLLAEGGRKATGVDVSAAAVAKGRSLGRDILRASATSLPFGVNEFDLVVSADVFEHLHEDDADAAVSEAIRVASKYIFMKIAEHEDVGQPWKRLAGHPLHLTTRPIEWWMEKFAHAGDYVRHQRQAFCLKLRHS